MPTSGHEAEDSGFIEDITQVYLHEIGVTPLLTADRGGQARAGRPCR
jgi:hypothetical protein